jgi:hypothetical protein
MLVRYIQTLTKFFLLPMTQTFTPVLDFTAHTTEKEPAGRFSAMAEPSFNTIQNILNYSKNLEIKKSRFVDAIEVMKS